MPMTEQAQIERAKDRLIQIIVDETDVKYFDISEVLDRLILHNFVDVGHILEWDLT